MDKVKAMMELKKFPKEGFSFCCHHNELFEYCSDFEGRVRAIYDTKPESEHETRFKNFTFIPTRLLPKEGLKELTKAQEAYYKAREARDKAWGAFVKTNGDKLLKLFNKLNPSNTWNGKNIGWR